MILSPRCLMLTLYYYPDNASFAPHLLLKETGLPHELRLVDREHNAQRDPDYLKLNPAGRIPTLVIDGQAVFETPAVMMAICEADPLHRFMPPLGHADRPKFYQWMAYLNNTLQAEFMVWRYPDRHAETAEASLSVKAAQDRRLGDILQLLDAALADRPYLLGQDISACDHLLFMLALWCDKRLSRPALSFSNIAALMRRMAGRPAVKEVCMIEQIDLSHLL